MNALDMLTLATFAADQILADEDRPGSLVLEVNFAISDAGWMVELVSLTSLNRLSRTAQILADMRSWDAECQKDFDESVDDRVEAKGRRMRREGVIRASGPRYPLTYGKGRSEASGTAQLLLRGTETWDMNNIKREHSLPRRAISMAQSRGRCTPDMQASLMAFFASPSSLTEHLLASFLPARPNYGALVTYLGNLGIEATKADISALKVFGANRATGRQGRPRKVRTYVGTLQGHSRPYVSDALPMGRIPGTSVGKGFGQGSGWAEVWAQGSALTPAQNLRRNIALDAFHAECQRQAQEASE